MDRKGTGGGLVALFISLLACGFLRAEEHVGRVLCLTEDTLGIVWMGTEEGLLGYDGIDYERYTTANSGLTGNVFNDIWAEPDGQRLWLGLKSGLAVMDLHTRRIRPFDIPGFYNIENLAPAADGGLWVLNIEDRYAHIRLRDDSVTIYEIADFPGVDRRPIALTDLGGDSLQVDALWRRWHIHLPTHTVRKVAQPEGWDDVAMRQTFTDRHGNQWRGGKNGLEHTLHLPPLFSMLPLPDGGHTTAHAMTTTADGTLWTAFTDRLMRQTGTPQSWRGRLPRDFFPLALVPDGEGRLLVGIDALGLWSTDLATGAAHPVPCAEPQLSVYTLLRQPSRWLAGTSRGVYEWREGSDSLRAVEAINRALPSHYIFTLVEDAEGRTWVGIYGSGIHVFDRSLRHLTSFNAKDGTFPSGAINHLFRDSRDRIWAATCEGVACFPDPQHPEHFEAYSLADGLPTLYCRAVGEDREGRIWVTTNQGLARWDEQTHLFYAYGVRGGLPQRPFCNAALLCLPDGRMAAGSEEGTVVFDPQQAAQGLTLPRLRLMRFTLLASGTNGEAAPHFVPQDSLTFTHRQNSFVLTFGFGDIALDGWVEYAYRIKGQGGWVPLGSTPRLTLHSLPPGSYIVEVKVRQMGQPWPDAAACSVAFRVRPPWWQTWWAYVLYVLAAGSLILYFMRSYRHRLDLENNLRYAESVIAELRKTLPPPSLVGREQLPSTAATSSSQIHSTPLPTREGQGGGSVGGKSSALISKLSEVIYANLDNPDLDIDFLCDRMAMSRSTLYRKVKSLLGMSTNEYIRWVRLGEAARRIQRGDLSDQTIAAIAADCGFSSLSHFRTCFKEQFGVSPSEYGKGNTPSQSCS